MTNNYLKFVEIGLLVDCNFRCPYCISEKNDNWKKLSKLDVFSLLKWLKKYTSDETLIMLTGGEPLYHENIKEFILGLKNKIVICSNVSLIDNNDWLFENSNLIEQICFRIGLHPTIRNDDYIFKIKKLMGYGYHVLVNYMITNNSSDKYIDSIISKLEENEISYELTLEIGASTRVKHNRRQNKILNVINNNYGVTIRGTGKILECQNGEQVGDVYDCSFQNTQRQKVYCQNCRSLWGYNKILRDWNFYDIYKLYPKKQNFQTRFDYNYFSENYKTTLINKK